MRVLIVCSGNSGDIAPFIKEQGESLKNTRIDVSYYCIKGKGILGYLKNLKPLKKKIREFSPQVIHAHYGFTGLLTNIQRRVPVITTYHGSDINILFNRFLSRHSILLSKHNIFVSEKIAKKAKVRKNFSVVPCGVDLNTFVPGDKVKARAKLNLGMEEKIILFPGAFDNRIKNLPLVQKSVELLNEKVRIIELKNLSRELVCTFMNACDVAVMSSKTEGSPQFIKECMACNCPAVSTDVGDVKQEFGKTEGYYISPDNPIYYTENLRKALAFAKNRSRTNGRERIKTLKLDIDSIAQNLLCIYTDIIEGK